MNLYLMTAAGLSSITTLVHFYLGGKGIAAPLLRASDIHDVPKYTNYYCWHLVTAMLAAMAVAFGWAALDPAAIEAAIMAQALAVFSLLWSLALIIWKKQNFLHMPQWVLFGAISIAGAQGLVA